MPPMNFNDPPPDDAELPGILSDLLDQAEHADLGLRRAAFERLYELALKVQTKISASVPTLIAGLADPDPQIGESAVWALHYCAPESLDPLIACLGHPDAFVRERAAHSLGNIGEVARVDAAPALQRLLSDPDQTVRKRAAWALGLTRDNSESTLERLAALVSKGTPGDAESALHALGNIGKTAGAGSLSRYRQVVLAALDRPESTIRRWALYAAESTGLAPQEWAKVLVDVIRRDESSEVRAAALSDLKAVASMVDLAEAVPTLLARLADASREAMLVCGVLADMRPRPTAAIPALHAILSNDELVIPASQALWRIEGRADVLIPALRRAFHDSAEEVCDLITELGPAASPLIPDVIQAMGDESWDLQWAAADALRAMASSDPQVMPPLLNALSHPSPIVQSASARALAAIGAPAVAPLKRLLEDRASMRATWAAYALGDMGPIAAAALEELRAGMRSGETPFFGCCAVAVASISGGTEAMPYLIEVVRGDDADGPRQAAAKALGDMGPAAVAAIDVLEALLDDEDDSDEVANEIIRALLAIRGIRH